MGTTTSFEDWLNENTPVSNSEIYSLWRAVYDQQSQGLWEVIPTRTGMIIKKGSDDGLMLASEAARKKFLRKLESFKDDRDADMETWWISKRDQS